MPIDEKATNGSAVTPDPDTATVVCPATKLAPEIVTLVTDATRLLARLIVEATGAGLTVKLLNAVRPACGHSRFT